MNSELESISFLLFAYQKVGKLNALTINMMITCVPIGTIRV